MYEAEFGPAVRAIHSAAQRFLDGEQGAASALDLAIRRHLHVVQGFDKLEVRGDELRIRLITNCRTWLSFSSIRPSGGATRHQVAEEIRTGTESFSNL
jgi:hypothetical protein